MGGRGGNSGLSGGSEIKTSNSIKTQFIQNGLNSKFKGVARMAKEGTGNYSYKDSKAVSSSEALKMEQVKIVERDAELFGEDSVDKQLIITFDDGVTVTNEDIFSESLELVESICSDDELRFGSCEASCMKIQIANIMSPRIGRWCTLTMVLEGHTENPFTIGTYRIESDKVTADRAWRELTAYDAMYDIINADVAEWYNTVLPDTDSTVTLKEFRDSFFEHFGIIQEIPIRTDSKGQEVTGLVNDSMTIEKTVDPGELSGKDVITAICEINGCFGHITREGTFKYIYIVQDMEGLYPSDDLYPADDLYPKDPKASPIAKSLYISATYEDYKASSITKLQIRKEENDIGSIVGDDGNCYIIEDNFLVYGKGADELEVIAGNTLSCITKCIYRPFTCDARGNPCREAGDAVRLSTKYELVESYILQRTLKGIQALRDDYESEGVEEYSEKVNSTNRSIVDLKGKTNILERNVEETNSRLTDVAENLESEISQAAGQIVMKVNSNGEIVQVALTSDADNGSEFYVKAKNINMTATELINFMTNGDINLSSNNITISSKYFSVSKDGNVKCNDIHSNHFGA